MKFAITGSNLQMVTCTLAPSESVYAEAGSMVNMSGNTQMTSVLKDGIVSGIVRVVAGEGLFLTQFLPRDGSGFVSFAGNVAGRIFPVRLKTGQDYIAQRSAFLCCEDGITLDVAFAQKIRTGLFGGSGFILQRFTGEGMVFLHCCGDIIELDLKPGEVVKTQTGLVVGFEDTIEYDIEMVGGISTILFGGEGLFVTTLTGPGKVVLQSMDVAKLAATLVTYLPKPKEIPVKK